MAMLARIPICQDKLSVFYRTLKNVWRRAIPWYPMNVSMHRVLRHLSNILRRLQRHFPTLGLWAISEEAHEGANKYAKDFLSNHAFQGDLVERGTQTFKRLWVRSDPEVHRNFDKKPK